MSSLSGPELAPRNGAVKRLVIFLHGLGADGNDLLSIGPMLDLPETHFLSPNAAFPCDMGYGYQWFAYYGSTREKAEKEVKIAAGLLNQFIDAQLARFKLTPKDVALIGFSQGSMMAMYTALRRPEPIAGIVGISGMLLAPELLAGEIKSRPPVCLIHGTADEVVQFASMGAAEDGLKLNQVPVEAHARPMLGHGIDEEGITIASKFLKRVFGL